MSTCRFCKLPEQRAKLIKYGVRHYAHAKCGFDAKGKAFIDALTDWQCYSQMPYRAAVEAGFEAELITRCDKYLADNPHIKDGRT